MRGLRSKWRAGGRYFEPESGGKRSVAAFAVLTAACCLFLGGCSEEEEMPLPSANAGEDISVAWGQVVVLNGECTHPDPAVRARLTHRWDMVDWPVASDLTPEDIDGRDAADAFFEPDASGQHTFTYQCAVGHFESSDLVSAESTVTATVKEPPENQPPVVDAGEDLIVEVGDTVRLMAEASDPDGDPLTFTWALLDSPGESDLSNEDIRDADTPDAGFVPDAAGLYRFLVRVDDGRGGVAEDDLDVTAVEVVRLDGELLVSVVDSETGLPVESALVSLTGDNSAGLSGRTDSEGVVALSHEALEGPVDIRVEGPEETVDIDHDGDSETEPLTVPRYRTMVLTGIDRGEATVLIEPTVPSRRTVGTGLVRGCIGGDLFDSLPELEQMFSVIEGGRMSGQLRMVLVSPVIPSSQQVDMEVSHFLVPSPYADIPLPGNMGTDDSFLNDWSAHFGIEAGPCVIDGESAPFAQFQQISPAGTQSFNVLGGVANVDLLKLLDLLLGATGVGSIQMEIASVLGAIDFDPLFMGFLEVEVPAGGEVDISSRLESRDSFDALKEVSYSAAQHVTEVCDSAGRCQELQQVRVFPATTIELAAGPLSSDPRVAAAMPDSSPFEIFCGDEQFAERCDPPHVIDLEAPEDTGTDIPYGLDLLLLDLPAGHVLAPSGGLALTGFKFSRAPGLSHEDNTFAVPPLEGPLSGSSYSGVSIGFRRLLSRGSDGSYFFQIGRVVDSTRGLVPGAMGSVDPGRDLPVLNVGSDGLEVEVLFAVEDPLEDPPEVTLAQAMAKGLSESETQMPLDETVTLSIDGPADLIAVTFSSVDRDVLGASRLPARTPRLTMLLSGDSTDLGVPDLHDLFGSGEEVWVDVVAYGLRGAFTYQQPHDPRLVEKRSALSSDSWSFLMP